MNIFKTTEDFVLDQWRKNFHTIIPNGYFIGSASNFFNSKHNVNSNDIDITLVYKEKISPRKLFEVCKNWRKKYHQNFNRFLDIYFLEESYLKNPSRIKNSKIFLTRANLLYQNTPFTFNQNHFHLPKLSDEEISSAQFIHFLVRYNRLPQEQNLLQDYIPLLSLSKIYMNKIDYKGLSKLETVEFALNNNLLTPAEVTFAKAFLAHRNRINSLGLAEKLKMELKNSLKNNFNDLERIKKQASLIAKKLELVDLNV